MARTSRPSTQEASPLPDRRRADRRGVTAPPRGVRLGVVAVVAAVAALVSGAFVVGAVSSGSAAQEQDARRELLDLSAVRMRALAATESAHLRLFDEGVDSASAEAILSDWEATMESLARAVPTRTATDLARPVAEQLRDVVGVRVEPITGDPVLSARVQLMSAQNRLVEGAVQSGLAGPDAVADRTAERLYVVGSSADLVVAAAADLPGARPEWTSFGVALRALGGAGAIGVLSAGPLSGWTGGTGAPERYVDLVASGSGPEAPPDAYLDTVAWSVGRLGIAPPADGVEATPSIVGDVVSDFLGGVDPGLVDAVVGALGDDGGEPPPMAAADALEESRSRIERISEVGEAGVADRAATLTSSVRAERQAASVWWTAAAAVAGASMAGVFLAAAAARRAQHRADRRSRVDALTGLANRAGFGVDVDGLDLSAGCWVVLVDLDHFKQVNDSFGHSAGDVVIVEAASAVGAVAEALGGVAARLGGDEFAVLAPAVDVHQVDRAVATLFDRLRVVDVAGRLCRLGCSVGIVGGAPGTEVSQLLAEADVAMYRAKRGGRNRAVYFDGATRAALARLGDGATGGAATGGTTVDVGVHLQRSLVDRSIVGAAVVPALLGDDGARIDGADLRLVAEVAGRRFGVLDLAIEGIAGSGRPIPPAGIRLWFEVVAADVVGLDGVAELRRRLAMVGLSGTPLGVVVIDAGMQDVGALVAAVAEIRAAGVEVALEVTGSGAVGLEALTASHVERLLIDAVTVEAVRRGDESSARTAAAVTELARRLGAEVAAVGVPALDVAASLHELGIGVAQVAAAEPWAPPTRRAAATR